MLHQLIEVEISEEMRREAKDKADKMGRLKNSITKGDGNEAGFMGELVAQKVTGGEIRNTRDYDIILPDGQTADVKTKRCTSAPEPHFECSIANFNTQQKCDKYIFVRVHKDMQKAWVLGEISKEEYYQKAVFVQQGQFDPSNKWRCSADCYNLKISELNEVKKMPQ